MRTRWKRYRIIVRENLIRLVRNDFENLVIGIVRRLYISKLKWNLARGCETSSPARGLSLQQSWRRDKSHKYCDFGSDYLFSPFGVLIPNQSNQDRKKNIKPWLFHYIFLNVQINVLIWWQLWLNKIFREYDVRCTGILTYNTTFF